jgi:mono/diheme cytochrome c family protein
MNLEKKIFIVGPVAVTLLAMWAINFAPGVSAQQEHQHPHAPASAKQLKNPLSVTEENIAGGRALFNQHCASCHGADGRAQTEMAATMKTKPADLTGSAVHGRTPGEIYWVITNGIKASGMPAFKDKMGEQERWQTVLYLQRLQGEHQRAAAGKAPEAAAKQETVQRPHQGHTATGQPSASGQQQMKNEPQAERGQHAGHDKAGDSTMAGGAHAGHDMMSDMMATVTGGPFRSMRALGSGTALQPASTPMYAWMFMPGEWMMMLHGELKIGYNQQGGPRGVGKAESENWLMLMAERRVGPGRLMLRGMFSAEPLTAPHGGFPELFQTGETYRRRPIIDAQHPHDLIMELAASYTVSISENVSFQLYGGPVGEPALGPVAFMHRASAMENPSAPLGHHWQDSTHITHGVMTGALTAGRFKFEVSGFRGAEPDEDRVALDMGKLDSYSFRSWFTPTPNWAMQFSYGHLTKPEALVPGDLDRLSASVSYNRPFTDGNWASSLIWGRNSEEHGNSNSYLFESTVNFLRKNYLYTRMELIDKAGLLVDNIFGRPGLARPPVLPRGGGEIQLPEEFERSFRVGAFTFGAVRDLISNEKLRMGIGADVVFYHKPSELDSVYGRRPTSFHVFLRFRPGAMR